MPLSPGKKVLVTVDDIEVKVMRPDVVPQAGTVHKRRTFRLILNQIPLSVAKERVEFVFVNVNGLEERELVVRAFVDAN